MQETLPAPIVERAIRSLACCIHDASPPIRASAALALGHIGLRGPVVWGNLEDSGLKALINKLVELLADSDHQAVAKIAKGIGFICQGLTPDSPIRETLVSGKYGIGTDNLCPSKHCGLMVHTHLLLFNIDQWHLVEYMYCLVKLTFSVLWQGLLSQSSQRVEDIQFSVGESLCFAFGQVPIATDVLLKSNFKSLEHSLSTADLVDSSDAEMADKHATDAYSATKDRILKCIFELVMSSRAEVRSTGCVWLVCLLSYTSKSSLILSSLEQIQSIFLGLIGDGNELTQEMASRGLSIVYALGDKEAKHKLVAGITGVLQGGNTAVKRMVKVDGDTTVFEQGQLGKAPGKSFLFFLN